MSNLEELISLADRAGFDATVIGPSGAARAFAHHKPQLIDFIEEPFSVCIAAPPYDANDRYRPFNLKSDDATYDIERNADLMRDAARALSADGLMFVYGLPRDLIRYATALSDELVFRYWIAVRAMTEQKPGGLRPEHTGLLALSKPGANLNRIRIPHPRCRCCGQTLKDWGGKSHLMHPDGVALSDVWMDLVVDPQSRMPSEVFERILHLSSQPNRSKLLLLIPDERPMIEDGFYQSLTNIFAFDPLKWRKAKSAATTERAVPDGLIDKLHKAPCLDVLKQIPSETVDLAFADPPFNLTKKYNGYADDRPDGDYLGWCKRWLLEYERVLKTGGAMFILNLPKWSARLADFLSRRGALYLQNWIVWNSLPEPKGVLMPAHYSLLYFTKGRSAARFNYCSMENGWEPFDEAVFPPDRADACGRRSCIRKRRASASSWRGELTDIWHDIHRERLPVKGELNAKAHPCETPERLVDRIIRLATNPGDVVLDAFAGTGATAMVAKRLGRRFIAIEQDGEYIRLASNRVGEQQSMQRPDNSMKRSGVSKRALQLELKRLAGRLGRLPTRRDVELLSRYELDLFESAFRSWGRALKAAKLVAGGSHLFAIRASHEREQLEMFDSLQPQPERAMTEARIENNCDEQSVAESFAEDTTVLSNQIS